MDYEEKDLEDYRSYISENSDFGWVTPEGKFYSVDFGNHYIFADEYIRENHYDDWKNKGKSYPTDYMVYQQHWVLLHNPYGDIPSPSYDEDYGITIAQQRFLYSYYLERKCDDEYKKISNIKIINKMN